MTGKSVGGDVSRRFEREVMEFGADSSMFVVLGAIALFNLLALVSIAGSILKEKTTMDSDTYALQILLSELVVMMNIPLYEALFLRKDEGRIPASVAYKSLIVAALPYLLTIYY